MISSHDIHVGADAFQERDVQIIEGVWFTRVWISALGPPITSEWLPASTVRRAIAWHGWRQAFESAHGAGIDLREGTVLGQMVRTCVEYELRTESLILDRMVAMMPDTATGPALDMLASLTGFTPTP